MKVSLISPYPDITAFGIRIISSYLKEQGYRTQLIFLPDPENLAYSEERYNNNVLDEVVSLC